MLHRAPPTKTIDVLVATPVGTNGQGGIDRVMATLQQALASEGEVDLNPTFVATRGTGHVAFSGLLLASFVARMLALRLAGRLDVVHLNVSSDGSTYRKLAIAAVARSFGIPYVLHLHGADYREFWSDRRPKLSEQIRIMFEGAASVIVLGRVWSDFIARRAPNARTVIIPNATERPRLPHVGGGDKAHILFLGRIGDRKGAPQLGEALGLMAGNPGWRATIAGDGAVEAARLRATELGLADRVAIPGWVGPDDVSRLISEADILVLPSFSENLPVSVIEGMAAGLAVVTTPVGAVEEIITDGETGLLVKPGDVAGLAAALTRVVDDPALRARLGEAARRVHRSRLDLPPFAAAVRSVWQAAAR